MGLLLAGFRAMDVVAKFKEVTTPMPNIEDDPDVRLIQAFYGPLAEETRRKLDPAFLARVDEDVARIIGGGGPEVPSSAGLFRALGHMGDERAEEVGREIAAAIHKQLLEEYERLTRRLHEAEEERTRLGREIEDLGKLRDGKA